MAVLLDVADSSKVGDIEPLGLFGQFTVQKSYRVELTRADLRKLLLEGYHLSLSFDCLLVETDDGLGRSHLEVLVSREEVFDA